MSLPILIVDDEIDSGNMLGKLLSAWGYHADAVGSGHEAVKMAQSRPYGLAIIDYRMPEMNGVDTFSRLRELQPDLTAIFLTGYATIDVIYPAIEAGILRVLTKPPDFQELLPIIEAHLGKGEPAHAARPA